MSGFVANNLYRFVAWALAALFLVATLRLSAGENAPERVSGDAAYERIAALLPEFAPGDWAVYDVGDMRFQVVVAKVKKTEEELRVSVKYGMLRTHERGTDGLLALFMDVGVLGELRKIVDEYDAFSIEPQEVPFRGGPVEGARVSGFKNGEEADLGPYLSRHVPLGLAGMHSTKWGEVRLIDCGWAKDKCPPPYRWGGLPGIGE